MYAYIYVYTNYYGLNVWSFPLPPVQVLKSNPQMSEYLEVKPLGGN